MAGTKSSVSTHFKQCVIGLGSQVFFHVQVLDWQWKLKFAHFVRKIWASFRSFLVLKISHVLMVKASDCDGLFDFKTTLVHLKGCWKITHHLSKNSIVVATLLSNTCEIGKVRDSLYKNIAHLTSHHLVVVVSLLNHICIFGQIPNSLYM